MVVEQSGKRKYMVGIVDEPILALRSVGSLSEGNIIRNGEEISKSDSLGIASHAHALATFFSNTDTPITVGIQGEWGSGKTSLLNTIHHLLVAENEFKQIWVNAWEHSLLSSPEDALIKITSEIISEMLTSDVSKVRSDRVKEYARTVLSGVLRIGATAALGTKGGKVADEIFSADAKSVSIKELRSELSELTNEIMNRQTNPFKKIIVYIDDLDRIEPKDAVQLLELLKNIFNVQGCIFVLAIDYQVVVKGLEHKFGKRSPENEWEFRAFFDKIIQLPFMMPIGQYDIGNYVLNLLRQIEFTAERELDSRLIEKIVLASIGGNPRSLKRLVNSLSLIQIFSEINLNELGDEESDASTSEDAQKYLLFTLVCIQIAFPDVYNFLVSNPNFEHWNADWAFGITRLKETEDEKFDRQFEAAKKTDDFDEDWEQALYRVCYLNPRYNSRISDISNILSIIKDRILEDADNIGDSVAAIIAKTAITNVTATDDPQQISRQGTRTFYDGMADWIIKLEEEGVADEWISFVKEMHEKAEGVGAETIFTRLAGCSLMVNGKKIGSLGVGGKRRPKFVMSFLKDFEKEYRLPMKLGLRAKHLRKFQLGKPTTAQQAEYCEVVIENISELETHKDELVSFIWRSVQIMNEHPDKLFPTKDLRKRISEGDEAAIEYARKTLSAEYTYDLT